MTYNIYALSVAAVALGVILIYGCFLVLASTDAALSQSDQRAEARGLTYLACLALAVLAFAVSGAA